MTNRLKVKLKSNKKRTNSQRAWLERQLNDPYVHQAKADGYRSRAAYKLVEIDQKYRILKPSQKIIDLGACPGGWTQVAVNRSKSQTNEKSRVIGVDLTEMDDIPGATVFQGDFTEDAIQNRLIELLDGKANVILSDMAAPACGMTDVDHIRIMMLVEEAFNFAENVLAPGGAFVAKVLRGGTETQLLNRLKAAFQKVTHFKPPASRKDSAEMYVVGIGFKG
ncbi:MAG: RlmE family RNA methyltransferase [Candidatus Paracaedibacteraceae bacterium]|nr:RlmE family RNA methyltransferase [Candidatus Paracaedibacteraceae bacterium]